MSDNNQPIDEEAQPLNVEQPAEQQAQEQPQEQPAEVTVEQPTEVVQEPVVEQPAPQPAEPVVQQQVQPAPVEEQPQEFPVENMDPPVKKGGYEKLQQQASPRGGDFTIQKKDMMELVTKTQEREVCEELDMLLSYGGDKPEVANKYMLDGFQTDAKQGIMTTSIQIREQQYGKNEFAARAPKTFLELVIEALDDLTMQILLICAAVSLVINFLFEDPTYAWIEPAAILAAVSACTLVAAGNDYQKEKQFIELNKVADDKKKITVIRNGEECQLHNSKLVVGDVVQIQEGMSIPCDGFVIKATEVSTDESAMTGETDAIKKGTIAQCYAFKEKNSGRIDYEDSLQAHTKKIPSPILLSGTKIMSGEGLFVVIVVGPDSCAGKIRSKLTDDEAEDGTPLQGKLEVLATDISLFGLIGASVTVLCLTILWTVRVTTSGKDWEWASLKWLLHYFITGVAVVIMAVPEGLPLAVTLSLAFSVKKMLKDKNLVRKLYACETMGGANCICSDKTGTLTMNEMHLVSMWNKQRIDFNFDPNDKYDLAAGQYNIQSQRCRDLLTMAMSCNASAKFGKVLEKGKQVQKWLGNKTEIALLEWITQAGANASELRATHIKEDDLRYPFSSSRKRMSTMVDYNGEKIMLIKGASEYILGACENYHDWTTDQNIDMTEALQTEIKQAIHGMARDTLRTLCLAYKSCPNVPEGDTPNAQGVYPIEEKGFTLICVTGIRDVLRPTVKASVKDCQIAGIKVRMVTGDNKVTAEAIAKDCGIITGHELPGYKTEEHVWLGRQFWEKIEGVEKVPKMVNKKPVMRDGKPVMVDKIKNMAAFNSIYEKLDVMARCRPEDKYAMVLGLIANRNVVAVTGDGTNDAPALKRADVGFAMGNAGTEVAREAADIILLDDNFTSIVKAVMWGRNIYDSVRKFLQFQLTINVVAVVVVFVSALQTQEAILTTVQMLWVNMIMDTFAALALATEPPHPRLLEKPPHDRDSYIVTKRMLKHIGIQAIFQAFILIIFTFAGENFIPESIKDTDAEVIERFNKPCIDDAKNNNECWNKLWTSYTEGEPKNPYSDYTDFRLNCPIVATKDGMIRSGRAFASWGMNYEYEPIGLIYGPSRHMTIIFNLFVFLQIYNFVNSRKIEDEMNIFEDISRSNWFIMIVLLIIFLQVMIVTLGHRAMSCSIGGLDLTQWMICLAVASGGLVVSLLTKVLTPKEYKTSESNQGNHKAHVVPAEAQ